MRAGPCLVLIVAVSCSKPKDPAPVPATPPAAGEAPVAKPRVPPSARPVIEATITSTTATQFEIESDVLTQALLYGMAGDLTVEQVAGGYRIADYAEGGLFSRLGLARGDVVKTINLVEITGSEALIAAYATARTTENIEVKLERAGQPVVLSYRIGAGRGGARYEPVVRAPTEEELALDGKITKIDDETYQVEREVLDALFGNFVGSRQARIVPSIKDGKANGFKLYAIRPHSPFSKVGFTNGDTIHAVNGKPVDTAERMLAVFTDIKTADKVVFDLTRRGKPTKLTLLVKAKK